MHHVPPRFHIWNDDDKMLLAIGPKEGGLYGYSAAGDRPYKLTGKCEITSVNGGSLTYELQLDDAVIYPNPYLTITPYGYFKHYFAGTERVATVRGNIHLHEWIDAPLTAPTPREHYIKELLRNPATFLSYDDCCSNEYAGKPTDNADYNGNSQQQLQYQENRVLLTALNLKFDENPILERIEDNIPEEEELYFYHPDHLGSASWITDHHGNPVQYLQYAPYGEITLDQHPFGYDERFKFTGKELDKETGYLFFGARNLESYYITGFTSVDPLADKYIGTQSYAYCNGNPIGLKDSDGRKIVFARGVSNSFKNDFRQAVIYMNNNGISGMLSQLEASPNIYYISEGIGINSSEFNAKTKTIIWFSRVGIITDNLYEMSPVEVLNHEIDHALQYDKNSNQQKIDKNTDDPNYGNKEEKRVITGSEQTTARKLGKIRKGEVTRNNHNGSLYETLSPISTEDKWSFTPSED